MHSYAYLYELHLTDAAAYLPVQSCDRSALSLEVCVRFPFIFISPCGELSWLPVFSRIEFSYIFVVDKAVTHTHICDHISILSTHID
jgi:hypothetical protein